MTEAAASMAGAGRRLWRASNGGFASAAGAATVLCLLALPFPAGADEGWQQRLGTFRIGLVADAGATRMVDVVADLKSAYAAALGVPVEIVVTSDYAALIDAQVDHRVDYGIYSATAYALAGQACECLSPLVAPTDSNGGIGIRSVLIVKAGVEAGLHDLPRLRVALGPDDDVAGHMLPLAELRGQGIDLHGDEPFFLRAPSMEEAERMFVAGKANAMFGWIETGRSPTPLPDAGTPRGLHDAGMADDAWRIAWTSDLFRFGPHAVRSDLDVEARRRLVPFLTGLKDADPALFETLERKHSGGFRPVDDADYETAREIVGAGAARKP